MEINYGIQGLRFFIILGVFIKHLNDIIGFPYFLDFGARGVELFFLLSGFLEGMHWYYKPELGKRLVWKSCFAFFKKKITKFYFLHFLTFLFSIPLVLSFSDKSKVELLITGVLNLALLQSWFDISKWSYNGVAWFLSTICFCYLLTPALSRLFSRKFLPSFLYLTALFSLKLILDTVHYCYFFPPYRFLEFSIAFVAGNLFLQTNFCNLLVNAGRKNKTFGNMWQSFWMIVTILSMIVGDQKWIPAIFIIPFIFLVVSLFINGIIGQFLSQRYLVSLGNLVFPFLLCHYLVIQYVSLFTNTILKLPASINLYFIAILSFCFSIGCSILLSCLNNYIIYRRHE